jgi:hypothetical protein
MVSPMVFLLLDFLEAVFFAAAETVDFLVIMSLTVSLSSALSLLVVVAMSSLTLLASTELSSLSLSSLALSSSSVLNSLTSNGAYYNMRQLFL